MENKNTESKSSSSGIKIHPHAFVDPKAELHDGVIIAQGAIIGPNVTIGKGTEIGPNSIITGRTKIGINNVKFRKPVVPGDQLIITCELLSIKRHRFGKVKGEAHVDGKLVCAGELMFSLVD